MMKEGLEKGWGSEASLGSDVKVTFLSAVSPLLVRAVSSSEPYEF